MGVMSCYRRNCDSILCRTYVDTVGYICNYCQEEFKSYLAAQPTNPHTDREMINFLKKFMETDKDSLNKEEGINVDAFFQEYTSD